MPNVGQSNVISSNTQVGVDVIKTGNIKDGEIVDADISASAAISWSKVSKTASSLADLATRLFTSLTDICGVTQGGTGAQTLTAHGVLVGQGTSAIAATGPGNAGQVLTSNGAAADPTFQANTAGKPGIFLATRDPSAVDGAVNYAHGLGGTPRHVRITAWLDGAEVTRRATSFGAFDGVNQSVMYQVDNTGASSVSVNSGAMVWISRYNSGLWVENATITVNSTNVVLTWGKSGTTPSSTIQLLIEAVL